jgi:hypothetical protein
MYAPVHLFVYSSNITEEILIKFNIWKFYILPKHSLRLKLDEYNCHFTWLPICIPAHILNTVHSIFNQINAPPPEQVVEPNEIYILFQIHFLSNSHGWNDFDKTPYCRSLIVWLGSFMLFKTASKVRNHEMKIQRQ